MRVSSGNLCSQRRNCKQLAPDFCTSIFFHIVWFGAEEWAAFQSERDFEDAVFHFLPQLRVWGGSA